MSASLPPLFPDRKVLLRKFDRSVSLLSWAYNEEENVEDFVRRAIALLEASVEEFELVIVDDGSRDQTPAILARLIKEFPQLRVVTNEVNRQVNYSWRRAIQSARKEYLFWQTLDWSYDISRLREFLELLKTYTVVAGVRRAPVAQATRFSRWLESVLQLFHHKHLTKRSDTVSKALVSVCNYCLIRCLFGVPISDYMNVMFIPTKLIQELKFESRGSFPEPLIKLYWLGHTFIEAPISFLPRQLGEAKGTRFLALYKATHDVITLWFKWVVLNRFSPKQPAPVRRFDPQEWEVAMPDEKAMPEQLSGPALGERA